MDVNKNGNAFGVIISYFILIIIGLYYPVFIVFAFKDYINLKYDEFKQRYGVLFRNIKQKQVIIYLSSFYFRRNLISITLVYLSSYSFVQWIIFLNLSFMALLLLISRQPFKESSNNKIEIFNEACIYLICVVFFNFLEFNESDAKQTLGWISICVFGLNIAINLLIIIIEMGKVVSQLISKIWKKKKKVEQNDFNQTSIVMKSQIDVFEKVQRNSYDISNFQNENNNLENNTKPLQLEDYHDYEERKEIQNKPQMKTNPLRYRMFEQM